MKRQGLDFLPKGVFKQKHDCLECGSRKAECKPVVKTATGKILWCCPSCFNKFDYEPFMK